MHSIRFRLGLCPRHCWGTLQRSPGPLAGFKGPTSKEREGRERRGREEKKKREGEGGGKERKGRGKEGKGREGRDPKLPDQIPPMIIIIKQKGVMQTADD